MEREDVNLASSSVQLALKRVSVAFAGQTPVLSEIDYSIRAGQFVSLVGPSGCGKTTILRLVAGLLAPTTGEVCVAGQPRIAFVFQEANLLPWRDVTNNIRLPLELLGVPRDEQDQAIRDSLQLIGLRRVDAEKYPRMLSGGMKMRVSLARAMVTHPEILLLDEPFAALDDMLRQQLNEDLLRIWGEQGWTGLFVTHNVSEAVFLSQQVAVMQAHPGRIVELIDIPFPYPRSPDLRGDPAFARLAALISQRLRETTS